MDLTSLRLETLRLTVEPSKNFTAPCWAISADRSNVGVALHVIKCGEVVDTLKLDDSRLYTLFGRFPTCGEDGVSVRLEHPSVSRVHAAIVRGENDLLFVIDLGSSHGTFVSGKRIEPFVSVAIHDRSVVRFGQSTRCYIVRVFPKNLTQAVDDEEVNTLVNCMVGYKEPSPMCPKLSEEIVPGKLERRVSFSCMAPEIIPDSQSVVPIIHEGSSTPLTFNSGSPEVSWLNRKTFNVPPLEYAFRPKSDSLPSLPAQSGSDEDEDISSSLDSLYDPSPILSTIYEQSDMMIEEGNTFVRRKSYSKRRSGRNGISSPKRVRPENF